MPVKTQFPNELDENGHLDVTRFLKRPDISAEAKARVRQAGIGNPANNAEAAECGLRFWIELFYMKRPELDNRQK